MHFRVGFFILLLCVSCGREYSNDNLAIFKYNESAGRVVLDDQKGHPGIKATSFEYGKINDEMLAMLDKPSPSYYLLLLGFLMALGLGALSLAIQVDVGIGFRCGSNFYLGCGCCCNCNFGCGCGRGYGCYFGRSCGFCGG